MILLGFVVGAVGTLIGVGGGFLVVPILLFLYPDKSNAWIVAVSMWMVAFNATSGSISYLYKRKVHIKAALIFIAASFPGSILGVWVERQVSRAGFEKIFGLSLVAYAVFILLRAKKVAGSASMAPDSKLPRKTFIQGALISFLVSIAASFLGIGGGVIHVPLLSQVLGFPVHMATGTSHSILACTAWFATAAHLYHGDISLSEPILWQLGGGAVVGAQLGAHLSPKVSGLWILRILAVALLLVGIRILIRG